MRNFKPCVAVILVLLANATSKCLAQQKKFIPGCSQAAFAAFKPLPRVEYDCPEGTNDYDDKILKLPGRIAALNDVVRTLQSFTDPAWWRTDVDSLNACEVHAAAGALTDEEKEKWRQGDYQFSLLGNHEMRVVLLSDPCYQTGFSGANAFLVLRKNGAVYVAQVLNGYYSRVDNSVGMDSIRWNGRQIVEISTANSFPPSLVSYYFEIDSRTNKALPKKLFRDGNKFTNEVYSDMLMADPKDLGLPQSAAELRVFVGKRLAPSFSAYEENEHGRIDANGRKLRRIVYRWNGRFYLRAK